MKVHFISIGGSIMHNLAIALFKKGWQVSGSDDEIFEPARSRLEALELLPPATGWHPENITPDLDMVVLGMHARKDNPELQKAIKLGIQLKSFPELIYEYSKNKKRIAIAGSHGKTTITSMVMHVLSKFDFDFDYLVGSKIDGFEDSVRLTEDAPLMVVEADEYLTSALDMRPKFLWYKPDIALISGIAWDHMNVFPTFDIYKKQFDLFIRSFPPDAFLAWYKHDTELQQLSHNWGKLKNSAYQKPQFHIRNNQIILNFLDRELPLHMQGVHNLVNMEGARLVLEQIGVTPEVFYSAIQDFKGAGKRLEIIAQQDNNIVFRDFAHAPSKVKATLEGIREQYEGKQLIACMELHTYSSLNPEFIPQYRGSTTSADNIFLFINKETVELKKMKLPEAPDILKAFDDKRIRVFYDIDEMESNLLELKPDNAAILLMSSGNFSNWDISCLLEKLSRQKGEGKRQK